MVMPCVVLACFIRMAKYIPAGPPPMIVIFMLSSTLIVQAKNSRPARWQDGLSGVNFVAVNHHFDEVFRVKKRLDYRSRMSRPILVYDLRQMPSQFPQRRSLQTNDITCSHWQRQYARINLQLSRWTLVGDNT